MFDYSVLAVDVDDLLLASDINLDNALNLFTFFAVQEKAKVHKISPAKVESLKREISQKMTKAFDENEFKYLPFPDKEFQMSSPDDNGYIFEAAKASFTDVICWALKAGIPIPDEFCKRVFLGEVADANAKAAPAQTMELQEAETLSVKEKRELGRLRKEKGKWNESIEAAVEAGLHYAKFPEGETLTKDAFADFIYEAGFKTLPDSTVEKIRAALPDEIKHKGGRPKGRKDAH
jgi:hypothetical protein